MARAGWRGSVGWLAALIVTTSASPTKALGQLPLSVWAKPVVAVPYGDFASRAEGVAARPGIGVDVGGSVTIGSLEVYGEYQRVDFECAECAEAGLEESVLDSGWGAGVILPLQWSIAGLNPRIRLGMIGHHLRFRSEDESAFSDESVGWTVGIGTELRRFGWLVLAPELLFNSYDTNVGFGIEVPDRELSVSYVSLGVALAIEP